MIKIGLFVFLTVYSLNVFAKFQLEGKYRCQGSDFLSKTKFDEPTTLTKIGDTYYFKWLNNGMVFFGRAILIDKTLSAVFWTPVDKSVVGIVSYAILPNGDLKGNWTLKDAHQVGDEYCTRLK